MDRTRLLQPVAFGVLLLVIITTVTRESTNQSSLTPIKYKRSRDQPTIQIDTTTRGYKNDLTSFNTLHVHKISHDSHLLLTREMYLGGYDRAHPELCPSLGSSTRLVILVTSAPSHFERRDAIRRSLKPHDDVVFAFMLGKPPQNLHSKIETEDALHGDIIEGRFIDTYSNLTLKTLSMLEWVDTYCPHTSYLLKTDDDMHINIELLLKMVPVSRFKTIYGKIWRRAKSIRTPQSKYYVPSRQFPINVYPDYVSGEAYMMTSDCVRLLLEAAPKQPYVRMEDVFFTGILASQLNIRRVNVLKFIGKIAVHV